VITPNRTYPWSFMTDRGGDHKTFEVTTST